MFDSIDHVQGYSKASCVLFVHPSLVLEDWRLYFLHVVAIGRIGRYGNLVDLVGNCLVLMFSLVDNWRCGDETIDEFCDIDASFLEEGVEDVLFGDFVRGGL